MNLIFKIWNSHKGQDDMVDSLDITDGLNSYKYNSIINNILINDPTACIRITIDSPIYMIIGLNDYIVTDLNGDDIKKKLPIKEGIHMINFPSINDLPKSKFSRYHKLELELFTYNEFDIQCKVIKRGKVKPNLVTFNEGYFKDESTIAVKKLFYNDFGGFMEFFNAETYCITMNKRDENYVKKLTPIITELNKPENRYVLGYEVLNPVRMEVDDNGHLTGRLYRNRNQVYSGTGTEWRDQVENILNNKPDRLPLIADANKISKYDAKNPISMIHGSIRSREMECDSLNEYLDSLSLALTEDIY